MTFAARLAEATGTASGVGLSTRTEHLLKALGLDPNGTLPPIDQIMSALRMDKKWAAGLRFVLLEDVGRPIVVDDVPTDQIEQTLRSMGAPE
jgi:3-dehydroquinate synthetase